MTNNKQQTPVELLAKLLLEKVEIKGDGYGINHIINLAKEMEKKQNKNRAVESYYLYTQYLEQLPKVGGATVEMDFEQWYEQTYGGGEQ
jgi:hypothetical protein